MKQETPNGVRHHKQDIVTMKSKLKSQKASIRKDLNKDVLTTDKTKNRRSYHIDIG